MERVPSSSRRTSDLCALVIATVFALANAPAFAAGRSKAKSKPKPPPEPTLVASALPGARSMTFDRRNLYLLTDEGVLRIARDGSAPKRIAEAEGAASLNLQRDRLYWLEPASGAVKTVRIDGGPVQALAENRKNARLLTSDLYALYWLEDSEKPVMYAMRRSGNAEATELVYLFSTLLDLQASGSHLYFTDHNGAVQQIGKFGGAPEVLNRDKLAPAGPLVVDDRYVFWTHPVAKTVQRKSRTGGRSTVLATSPTAPRAIAIDRNHVYWVDEGGPERKTAILRVPKRGGKTVTLIERDHPVTELAVQDGWLYWIEGPSDARAIQKLKV